MNLASRKIISQKNTASDGRAQVALALDLGGTKLASALVSNRGEVTGRSTIALSQRSGRQVGKLIRDEFHRLRALARLNDWDFSGIGIAVPGAVRRESGQVWAPNIKGWSDYPLRREVQRYAGRANGAVSIIADRSAYILGESWLGKAKGKSNALFLAVGTGIGLGILANGQIVEGTHGLAGAVGWMALNPAYLRGYKKYGCFEFHASGNGLVRIASSQAKASRYKSSEQIFAASEAGGREARQVLNEAVRWWGMGIANLVSIFDPEIIVLGGGVFGPGGRLLRSIGREAQRWAQPLAGKTIDIVVSELGGNAGLLGAARAVFTGETILLE